MACASKLKPCHRVRLHFAAGMRRHHSKRHRHRCVCVMIFSLDASLTRCTTKAFGFVAMRVTVAMDRCDSNKFPSKLVSVCVCVCVDTKKTEIRFSAAFYSVTSYDFGILFFIMSSVGVRCSSTILTHYFNRAILFDNRQPHAHPQPSLRCFGMISIVTQFNVTT